MKVTLKERQHPDGIKLGHIKCGAMIKHENSVYIKMDKKHGIGITLAWPEKHGLLLNLKYGTIRAVKSDLLGVPLCQDDLVVYKAPIHQYGNFVKTSHAHEYGPMQC